MRLTTLGRAGASEYREDFAVLKKEQTAHSRPETAVHLLGLGDMGHVAIRVSCRSRK